MKSAIPFIREGSVNFVLLSTDPGGVLHHSTSIHGAVVQGSTFPYGGGPSPARKADYREAKIPSASVEVGSWPRKAKPQNARWEVRDHLLATMIVSERS